jgi:preprotein translocase subunit SecY
VNFLKDIILHVRVPVLSENTYSTWPNSSFKLLDYALISKSCSWSYIIMSFCIIFAYQYLTTSKVTISEIGTKLVKIKIQVPNFWSQYEK